MVALPAAQADTPEVQITITAVSPTTLYQGGQLQISGTVTNATGRGLSGLQVVLWQSPDAITNVHDLDAALISEDVATPKGETFGRSQSLAVTAKGTLPAGATVPFALFGSPTLATPGAAYLVGIQVLDSSGQVLARARLMIGCMNYDQPLVSVLIVPLTAKPSMVQPAVTGDIPSPAVFMDESLAGELGGQLGQLLALSSHPGVTPLIDPLLVTELTQMAAGYQVISSPDAQPVEGAGQAAAQNALDQITAIINNGGAYRLPSGNPDMNAVAKLPNAKSVAAAAVAPADPNNPAETLPLAVLSKRAAISSAAERLIAQLRPALALSDALQPASTVQVSGVVTWMAVTSVTQLNALTGPLPLFRGDALVQSTTARWARLMVADAQDAPTVLMADDSTTAQIAMSWMDTGWQPTQLEHIVNGVKPAKLVWAVDPPSVTLPDDLLTAVTGNERALNLLSDVGDDHDQAASLGARLLPGAVSQSWQSDWAASLSWLNMASAGLNQQTGDGGVELHTAAQWHLSASNNRMPITITNTLGIPVTVQVRFVSDNSRRLDVPNSDLVTIDADSTTSVVVAPKAYGNGSVRVAVQLVSASGTLVGKPAQVQVVVTTAGRLGWIIIIGSGIAFVVATSLRVRQVRRQRKSDTPSSPDQEN